jgi:predicted ATPase/DNA-binding SARP family transcriptional activator
MQFRVIGPLQVGPADAAATVPGRKERAVLAALLVDLGRARSAEELVTAVWGEDAPRSAEKSLQVRLSHLRSSLPAGRDVVVRDGRGYRLAVDPDLVDAYRFERLVDEAARHPPAAALERYEQALALVRGRPYADVEEFAGLAAEIRRLDALRLRAVEGRLRALLDLGRHAEALPELERVVRDEPHHEAFTALLMLALYRAGRQVEALEAYRRTAAQLFELGLEPSEGLRRLEASILSHDVDVAPPQEAHTNLPARLTSFVGREAELAQLAELLHARRIVTVTGAGGVGKSALAAEAARALAGELTDGVWVVELASLEHPDQVPAAIADAIPFGAAGADLRGAGREAIDVLCERLAGRRALLVLETCEHLAAGVARVAERVLGTAEGVRVLATSRQPLGAQGEALLELRPFDPEGGEALRLFVERARAAQPSFRLDPDTRAAATTICARLDGLPLALELAAARVRALPVAEIAARLDDRFALLGDARDAGGTRRTLGHVVAWSFGLLPPAEQELFCRLAIFRGPFSLDAAERVAGGGPVDRAALPDLLTALVERSMVSVDDGRYRLLETLRAFGLARLEEREGGLERCRLRHTGWAAALADTQARRMYAEGVDAVRAELAPYRPDLDVAAELALDERDGERAQPLATALGVLDFGLGDSARGRTRLARALRLDAPHATRVPALIVQSALLTLHGLVEPGRAAATEALELAEDDRWRDRALAFLGCARLLGGDVHGAMQDLGGLEERLTLRGETWLRGFVSGWQGFVKLVLGDLHEARRLSTRAMQAFERCNDVWGVLTAAVNLGRVDRALGSYDEAARALERALEVGEARVPGRLGPLLHDFGVVQLRREQFDHAAELWQRCTEVAGSPSATGGWVLLTGPAERWYAVMAAGHLARLDGEDERAATRYAEARALLEVVEREDRTTIGIDAAIAAALLAQGDVTDPAASGPLLREALGRAMRSGDQRLVAQSLDALARLVDSPVQGAELLGAAAAVRDAAGGPLPPVEARAVEAIALSLRALVGDEAFEAARARGRADPMAVALAVVSRP